MGDKKVRQACRDREPLGGADAQALEHALTQLEEELSSARAELTKVLEENHELDVDRAKRRSQAKRYQKSAGRRHKRVEAMESRIVLLEDVRLWAENMTIVCADDDRDCENLCDMCGGFDRMNDALTRLELAETQDK